MTLNGYDSAVENFYEMALKKDIQKTKISCQTLRAADLRCILCSDGYPPESGKINWLHLWPDENLLD
jgi:hypothetical protein